MEINYCRHCGVLLDVKGRWYCYVCSALLEVVIRRMGAKDSGPEQHLHYDYE